jgi:hypothetical protein
MVVDEAMVMTEASAIDILMLLAAVRCSVEAYVVADVPIRVATFSVLLVCCTVTVD